MSARGNRKPGWRSRPLFWICVILGAGALAGYLTRPQGSRATDVVRSSLRTTPDGVAALSRAISRLGRHTAPRFTPMADADPLRGTIAIVQPRAIPSPRETEALLERVRSGGTLLYVPAARSAGPISSPLMIGLGIWFRSPPVTDSAEVRWGNHFLVDGLSLPDSLRYGFRPIPWEEPADSLRADVEAEAGGADEDARRQGDSVKADSAGSDSAAAGSAGALSAEAQADLQEALDSLRARMERGGIPGVDDAGPPEPLLTVTDSAGTELMAAALFRVGEGRIVVLAEARPLANGKAGDSPLAILAVRAALAYTDEADTVFFDEFHQGITGGRTRARVLADFFLGSPGGLTLSHVALICFLFLACKGLRFGIPNTAVAPADRERRSPLEHVSALGDLYRKAGASNTAALLLLSPLASAARLPPPRDLDEAAALIGEVRARGGRQAALDRVQNGLDAQPVDLTLIAAGVDEHLARRFNK